MKDWLVSAGLAAGALLLFWALLFPKSSESGDAVSMPTSAERGPAGYLALRRWLDAEGVPVVEWRERYDKLLPPQGSKVVPNTGDLLITTMPHANPVRRAELERLDAWVQRGNTLLVVAALDDTPKWSAIAYTLDLEEQLARLTRLKVTVIDPSLGDTTGRLKDRIDAAFAPAAVSLEPVKTALGVHPLFAGVERVSARSDLPASRWQAAAMDSSPVLELARRSDNGDAAVWLKAIRKGRVIVSAFASPFSNAQLGEAGNARWLANIVVGSLGPGGRVIIDDAHQGVVSYYDPAAFFADARLHHALWWIVLVWFMYVVAAPHLRQAPARRPPIDDVAMLRLTARFYAGSVAARSAGARLLEHFFNGIRRRRSMREDGTPVWGWLAAQARVPHAELEELRAIDEKIRTGRRFDLPRLQSLLSTLSGHLA